MLEMIYQISLLKPYSSNISKRFIKSSKLFITDSGILSHLLNITTPDELINSTKKGEIIEATITDLAFGGRGLVRIDGMAVFVDPAVPGDRVRARVFKKRKNYAEARVMDVLTPSTDRVPPPCPYNGWCGGCKSQFLDYDRQLVYKQHQVADSLAHIGSLEDIPVHPVIPSEKKCFNIFLK